MTKAVAYTRFSSDNQREESIEAQMKSIKEYADRNNITIIREYKDEAMTGTTDKRPAFQQMIKDSAGGLFSLALVHKGNRFARNRIESAINKYALKQNGVKVIAVAEDFGDGHHAVLMESVLEGLAEFYSLELAAETMKGLLVNADKCLYNGGWVLYGYKVNDERKYEIEPEEAKIVREIFDRVHNGWSYGKIIQDFKIRGILRRGKHWNKNTIYDMLKNERYTGVYIYNETPRKVNDKRNNRIKKENDEVVRIPGGMPVIISKETFNRVQGILRGRVRPRGRKNTYILTGLIECGSCGAAYVGTNSYCDKKEYLWYECSGKKRRGNCESKGRIRKEVLEEAAVNYIVQQTEELDPEEFTREYNAFLDMFTEGAFERIHSINKELKEISVKVDRLLDAIEAGVDVKSRLKAHTERKQLLQETLRKAEVEKLAQYVTPEQVQALIDMFDPRKAETEEEKKAVIHRIIKKIIIRGKGEDAEFHTVWDPSDTAYVASPTPYLCALFADIIRDELLTR
ncbi:recombinase family protein [Candidatus Contubernalis alkaliaceticus]|uniref:recombinase family protein n=1 Tax=Candidatus Contubernalis alkaliaceticus TaxID=338645 RepID=UPI001F4C2E61|nr:recombinase family protein [Candidatus Contubernalis alkalaceticus]UNC91640.1 recombinase family protein [Candidatus Contubernalis alkalaceticus]